MSRHWSAVLIVAFALTTPAKLAAQQPASAGATRPNLRVLQALPESQLFPLMNLLADSLGVRCDFCHVQVAPDLTKTPSNIGGWVWDRDDKPAKRKAREMMRMVVELNSGRFGGQSSVTCYTCHRGSTQPVRTPPMPPNDTTRTPAAPTLPSADRVWTNYVNAVGQSDRTAREAGTIISGWDDRSEGRYGKIEITLGGPDQYRATLTTQDGPTSQGLDGELGWLANKDRVQQLSADDLARLRRVALRYRPVKAERPTNLQIIGVERLGECDAYVAKARIDAITTRMLYFDTVTGLLRREVTTTETLLLPLEEQVDYDDYRDVNGVQLPFRMRMSDGAPYSTVTRTFTDIRRNVTVDDAVFRPPTKF